MTQVRVHDDEPIAGGNTRAIEDRAGEAERRVVALE